MQGTGIMNQIIVIDEWPLHTKHMSPCCISRGINLFNFALAGKLWPRTAAVCIAAVILLLMSSSGGVAAAQKPTKASSSAEATPQQIQQLMTLLADPKVRDWLEQESKAEAASEQAVAQESVSQALDGRLAAIREHIVALTGTIPDLPNQYERGPDLVT